MAKVEMIANHTIYVAGDRAPVERGQSFRISQDEAQRLHTLGAANYAPQTTLDLVAEDVTEQAQPVQTMPEAPIEAVEAEEVVEDAEEEASVENTEPDKATKLAKATKPAKATKNAKTAELVG